MMRLMTNDAVIIVEHLDQLVDGGLIDAAVTFRDRFIYCIAFRHEFHRLTLNPSYWYLIG